MSLDQDDALLSNNSHTLSNNQNNNTVKSNAPFQYDSTGFMNSFYLAQLNNNLNGIFGINTDHSANLSRPVTQQQQQQQQQQLSNPYLNSKLNLNQNDFQNQVINALNHNNNNNSHHQLSHQSLLNASKSSTTFGLDNNVKLSPPSSSHQHLNTMGDQHQQQATMFNDIGLLNMASVMNLSSYLNSNSSSSPSSSSSSASSTSSATLLNTASTSSLNNSSNSLFNHSINTSQHHWLLSSPRQCTSCPERPEATCYCHDCKEKLCHSCMLAHQRVRLTKDHRVQFFACSETSSGSIEALLALNGANVQGGAGHHAPLAQQHSSSASTPPSSSSSSSSTNGNSSLASSSNGRNHLSSMGLMQSTELELNLNVQSATCNNTILNNSNNNNNNNAASLISPHSHLVNSSQAILGTSLNGSVNPTNFIGASNLFGNEAELNTSHIAGNQNALALQVSR